MQGVLHEVAMREHHALRRPGRAARVEEAGHCLIREIGGEFGRLRVREQLLVAVVEVDHLLHARGEAVDHAVR